MWYPSAVISSLIKVIIIYHKSMIQTVVRTVSCHKETKTILDLGCRHVYLCCIVGHCNLTISLSQPASSGHLTNWNFNINMLTLVQVFLQHYLAQEHSFKSIFILFLDNCYGRWWLCVWELRLITAGRRLNSRSHLALMRSDQPGTPDLTPSLDLPPPDTSVWSTTTTPSPTITTRG